MLRSIDRRVYISTAAVGEVWRVVVIVIVVWFGPVSCITVREEMW